MAAVSLGSRHALPAASTASPAGSTLGGSDTVAACASGTRVVEVRQRHLVEVEARPGEQRVGAVADLQGAVRPVKIRRGSGRPGSRCARWKVGYVGLVPFQPGWPPVSQVAVGGSAGACRAGRRGAGPPWRVAVVASTMPTLARS